MSKQLEYHVDRRGGVMLIQPVGRLDSSQIARFEEVVMGQVQTGRHDVVLDFEQLTFLSSSALRILLGAARQAKNRNNAFLLCALKPHITDLMKTAGFDRLLRIHDTRKQAMQSAAEARAQTPRPPNPPRRRRPSLPPTRTRSARSRQQRGRGGAPTSRSGGSSSRHGRGCGGTCASTRR